MKAGTRWRGYSALLSACLFLVACGAAQDASQTANVTDLSVILGATSTTTDAAPILIRAVAKDKDGNPVKNATAEFRSSLGSVSSTSVITDSDGVADVEFQSLVAGTATLTISCGSEVVQKTVTVSQAAQSSTVPAYLSLATSQTSVATNNKDTAVLTATVLDANRGVISGITVSFTATAGQMSVVNAVTNSDGVATTRFSSGDIDSTNRVVTITATAGSLSRQIPLQVNGTTISVSTNSDFLVLGGAAADQSRTVTLTAKDGGDRPLYNQTLSVAVAGTGATPGSATLSASTLTTDINGQATVTLTAVGTGEVQVTITGLGVTVNKSFTIQNQVQAFYISDPTTEQLALDIGSSKVIQVAAPTQASVTFVTTLGTVTAGGPAAKQVVVPVVAGVASATLTSNTGGVATVDVFDTADPTVVDRLYVSFAAPSANANSVEVQADKKVLPLSSGELSYLSTITATVFDAQGYPVQGAPVWFSISNSTGGGERLNLAYAVTGTDGRAETTFASGSISSAQDGVLITATISTGANDSIAVVIGGTAGSLAVGHSSTISSINSGTAYKLAMSVLVADSNGNPLAGTTVSLSSWPYAYFTGYWVDTLSGTTDKKCQQERTSGWNKVLGVTNNPNSTGDPEAIPNEDNNENLFLDAGEDDNGDSSLTPENSSAGTLPQTVLTDSNGVATFDLVYLKQYAGWVVARIRASTVVLGSETTSSLEMVLPYEVTEAEACFLPESPFGTDDTWRVPNN